MKKTLKIAIIVVIILIIIITIILFSLKNTTNLTNDTNNIVNNQLDYTNNNNQNTLNSSNESTSNQQFKMENDRSMYLYIERLAEDTIENMMMYNSDEMIKYNLRIDSEEDLKEEKNKIKNTLENTFSKNLLNEIGINQILSNKKIQLNEAYNVNKIYKKAISNKNEVFLVFGQFTKSNENYSFLINLDKSSNAYEIYTDEYIIKYNLNEDNINNVDINAASVVKNEYNAINNTVDYSDEVIAKKYFNYFQYYIKSNPKKIYDILDEKYKSAKFPTYEDFKKYADSYKTTNISKYKIKKNDLYNEVVCIDEAGRYIYFREKSVMQFTMVLDNYTLDINIFSAEYNAESKNKIVNLNIEKISQMVNNADYGILYSKLNETFKNNNFRNLDSFKTYVTSNFYGLNRLEVISINENKDYLTARVRVINKEKDSQRKLMTISMKLINKIDFEMSFSFDEN